jgi:hypothetical protein
LDSAHKCLRGPGRAFEKEWSTVSYFGNTIFAAVVLLGLAIYGFYASLAGQPFLKGKLLED